MFFFNILFYIVVVRGIPVKRKIWGDIAMITIKEIAGILGVSPTTVSNVVNGHTQKMSPATRRRVEEALIKYEFNKAYPEKIYSKSLKLISVDFYIRYKEKIFTDPFCSALLDSIGEQLQGYRRYPVCGAPKDIKDIYEKLSGTDVEGGIVVGLDPVECYELSVRAGKPVVFIDCGEGDYYNVGIDDYDGAKMITRYMLKQGHRKIAFFCDRKNPVSSNFERFRGYCDSLAEYSIRYNNQDYYYLPSDRHFRREILRKFAATAKQKGYTAVFVVSDLLAHEAILAFRDEGLRVPEDISVTGFDDNSYSRLSRPMITTIRQPVVEKGQEAAKLLMRLIAGEEVTPKSIRLPVELIVRDSVAYHLD